MNIATRNKCMQSSTGAVDGGTARGVRGSD